jgi:hypothetical protein
MSNGKKNIVVYGNLKSLYSSKLREVRHDISKVLKTNARISPIYPRDKGRPGYICFITVWTYEPVDTHEPYVIQKPLHWCQEGR